MQKGFNPDEKASTRLSGHFDSQFCIALLSAEKNVQLQGPSLTVPQLMQAVFITAARGAAIMLAARQQNSKQ